jgi:prolyl oligopeptidase
MKPMIDRREFLSLSATAAGASLLPKALLAMTAQAKTVPLAPVARVDVVKDTYFGDTVSDPYRWMENSKDPDWLPYLRGQNDHARAILDGLPARGALLKRIEELSGDMVTTGKVERAGGLTFYQQRPLGADNFKLFVRDANGSDRVLINPTLVSGPKGHTSLDWWQPSPDGKYVVYGLSKNGSEDSLLHVLTVADGKDLPDRIPDTQGADPAWLDDASGFFYNQLTGKVDTPERFLDSRARFHKLGTDPGKDPILMQRGLVADIVYEKIQAPRIGTFFGCKHAVLTLSDVRPEFRSFTAPLADVLAGKAKWTEFTKFEDEITEIDVEGDDAYLVANKGTPRGRVLKASVATPNVQTAQLVVPQGSDVIENVAIAKDGIYVQIMDGGVSRLRRLKRDGTMSEIKLPFDGTIGTVRTVLSEEGAYFGLTGWLSPPAVYQVAADGSLSDTHINPKPNIDVSAYESKRLFASAKDGVKIPYTLIYKKGLKLDGSAPAWISAYGSYGIPAYTPSFAGRSLALVDQGAIVGYANVRGGGEYGREWHKAGQLKNKPNTWRDLIAVCEDMIAKKYTSPKHLAIGGRSAGGITVGRALTERPDLFAAVVDGVGWSNPLRYVAEQNGYGEEPEWGAITDPEGYKALKSIDSYQAVKDGTAYPAVLLTTGVTDPRVAPFHVAKMTARLQAASSSGKPILLRVDYDAGHGIGSTRSQQDREAADTYAFLLWQLKSSG